MSATIKDQLPGLTAELMALVRQPVAPRGREISRTAWEAKILRILTRAFEAGQAQGSSLADPERLLDVLVQAPVTHTMFEVTTCDKTVADLADLIAATHATLPQFPHH